MLKEFSGDNILISNNAITKYFETEKRQVDNKLAASNSMYKYAQPENIDDFKSTPLINGHQSALPRNEPKHINERYGAVITEDELNISQILPDKERGMSKQPIYNANNKQTTNFAKFRSDY